MIQQEKNSTKEKSVCQVELLATQDAVWEEHYRINTTSLKQHMKGMLPNVLLEVSKGEDEMKKEKIMCKASLKHLQQSTDLKELFSRQIV